MPEETFPPSENVIETQIAEAAMTGVQSVSVDGVSTTRMSISEMIKGDKYLMQKRAARKNPLGFLKIFRIRSGR